MSLFRPMRRDRPAARTSAAIFGRACAAGAASSPARGMGRVGISIRRPPAPIRIRSRPVTGTSASRRWSTQSSPLNLGERTQPGRPSTGTAPKWARRRRLPGSTGMPKWSMQPPAASIPAGITSRRSVIAEAPAISTISASALRAAAMAAETASVSCGTRVSERRRLPMDSIRPRTMATVLSRTDSLRPDRRVWMRATPRARKGATRTSGPPWLASATARARSALGTANGMILTVATICFASTTAWGARVAMVMASSMVLIASTRARSMMARPRVAANRLARPVKALAVSAPAPHAALAMAAAASFSCASVSSRRATMTRAIPAAAIEAVSSSDRRRPFFKIVPRAPSGPGRTRLCAKIAPTASPTGSSPNFIRARRCRSRAREAPVSPGP